VLVAGRFVVRDDTPVPDVFPGRAIPARAAAAP
jgi:hypothetical protein